MKPSVLPSASTSFFGRLLTPGVCRQRSGSLRRAFFPQQTHRTVFQPSTVRAPDDAPASRVRKQRPLCAAHDQKSFSELLVEIARCQDVHQTPQFLDETSTAIQESARYIYEHYEEPVSLAAAAAVAHMNPTYFSKKFRETTGFGFKEYLTHIRLQNAAHLLRTTDTSITEIAGICGFPTAIISGTRSGNTMACRRAPTG